MGQEELELEQEQEQEQGQGYTKWAATLVEQLSRLYGYGLVGVGVNIVFILSLASLPFTKWVTSDDGSIKPVVNWIPWNIYW